MSPERWKQIEEVYEAVRAQEPEQRAHCLHEHCGGDAALREEVESLLAQETRADRMLGAPAWERVSAEIAGRTASIAHLAPGTQLGPYRVISLLGHGGMGEVYRAKDTRLGRDVALKFLLAGRLQDDERRRRFAQEARSASALNHPHIVTFYDLAEADGQQMLVLEYVSGKSLDKIIPRKGLPLKEALGYAIQIADALAAAHKAGIVHRDLKPSNIVMTETGSIKLLDFGLAKLTEPVQPRDGDSPAPAVQTREGLILGTLSYMSPEQAEGKPVDARSDLFSFGCVLYEMITGQRAFAGDSVATTVSAILRDDPKPLTALRADVPDELDRIVRRCLRKDPSRRFQNASDLQVALVEVEEELGVQSPAAIRLGARRRSKQAPSCACVGISAGRCRSGCGRRVHLHQGRRRPDARAAYGECRRSSAYVLSRISDAAEFVARRQPGRFCVERRERGQFRHLCEAGWTWGTAAADHQSGVG